MKFFGTLFASILGSLIAFGLLFFLFFAIISALGSSDVVQVKAKSILHITMDDPIVERSEPNVAAPISLNQSERIGINQIIEKLEGAKHDDRIAGIYLDVDAVAGMPSEIIEVHDALEDFKASGKWILAYAESMSQAAYFINSVADEVHLNPVGGMEIKGLGSEMMYYKNALEKFGIEVQVFKGPNNKYKSAVEPFLYDHMTEENREQTKEFLGDIWSDMIERIATSRNISTQKINEIAADILVRNPQDAKDLGLIDGLSYFDQLLEKMQEKVGAESPKDLEFISLADYITVPTKRAEGEAKPKFGADQVAVVYAVGGIESGKGSDDAIGSDRIAKALRKARLDEKVKAVVLRVNSPGGSALASDVIWRETIKIKESGKPFIVSMSALAASGGYYISCGADRIFAHESTITGSIGVFGMLPNAEQLLREDLGITFDKVGTHEHSSMSLGLRPIEGEMMAVIEESIAKVYDDFLSRVSEGRGMTKAEVDAIAQGRVWSGADAVNIGLVDEIGNLEKAVEYAAAQAGMEEYKQINMPKMIDPFEELMEQFGQKATAEIGATIFEGQEAVYEEILEVKRLMNADQIQMRMPYSLRIH